MGLSPTATAMRSFAVTTVRARPIRFIPLLMHSQFCTYLLRNHYDLCVESWSVRYLRRQKGRQHLSCEVTCMREACIERMPCTVPVSSIACSICQLPSQAAPAVGPRPWMPYQHFVEVLLIFVTIVFAGIAHLFYERSSNLYAPIPRNSQGCACTD